MGGSGGAEIGAGDNFSEGQSLTAADGRRLRSEVECIKRVSNESISVVSTGVDRLFDSCLATMYCNCKRKKQNNYVLPPSHRYHEQYIFCECPFFVTSRVATGGHRKSVQCSHV